MRDKKIDFKIKLEGIEVPVKKFYVISQKNVPCFISLEVMSVPEIKNIMTDTIIELYWRVNNGEYNFMLDANITSKNIRKLGDTYERIMVGMQFVNKVNDVPYRYIDLMAPTGITNYEYKFINMDKTTETKRIVARTLEGINWGILEDIVYKFKDKPVEKYFFQFIDATIGKNAWEDYYKNIDKRLQIKKSHVLVDSGQFYAIYEAKTFVKMILNQIAQIRDGFVLDELMKVFINAGYSYLSPTNPVFNFNKLKDTPDNLLFASEANAIAKHVLTPELSNCIPPRCNVIFAGKGANITIQIDDKPITRLLNNFLWDSNNNEPLYCSVYPPELTSKVGANTNPFVSNSIEDYSLTEEEKKVGMNALVQNKNYLFTILMDFNEVEKDNKAIQRKLNKITEYDYHKLRSIKNKINIDIPEFLPDLVSGLPALVYDPDVGEWYYGEITYLNYNVDLEEGFISTSIVLQNAREIKDIRDIVGERVDSSNGDYRYEYNKMSPYLPTKFNPFQGNTITLNDKWLSYISKEYYQKVIGGNGKEEGWKSVVDMTEIVGGEEQAISPEDVLDKIEAKYTSGTQDKFVKRNIATEYEYYTTILGEYTPSETAEASRIKIVAQKEALSESILTLAQISEQINSSKKPRYVEERRTKTTELQAALKKVEIYDA